MDLWDQIGAKLDDIINGVTGVTAANKTAQVVADRQQNSDALASTVPPEHQAAVRAALTAVYEARDQVANAQSDPERRSAWSAQSKAETEFANTLEKVADSQRKAAGKQTDPAQQALWTARADALKAHSEEARQRVALLTNKDASQTANINSQIEARNNAAKIADARLAIAEAKSPADIERALSQSQAAVALAQQRNTLTPALLAEHNARVDELISRSKYYDGRTILTRAQVDQAEARGDLSKAEAEQIRLLGPIKAADLAARTGLSQARANQIVANINRWQLAPASDSHVPTLTQFQPSTGEIRGVPNPSYVNPQGQALKDGMAAIDQVEQMLGSGQIEPDDATRLIQNIKTSIDAQTRGFTPEQLAQQQTEQARIGAQQLQNRVTAGTSMLDSLMGRAMGSKIMNVPAGLGQGLVSGIQDWVTQLGGGQDVYNTAAQLVKNLAPQGDQRDLGSATAAIADGLRKYKEQTGKDHPIVDASKQMDSGDQSQRNQPLTDISPQLIASDNQNTPFAQSDLPEGRGLGPDALTLLQAAGAR